MRRVVLAALLGLVASLWCAASLWALPPEVTVRFLDVGQGDAILIQTSDDKVALIDAGPPEAGPVITQQLDALEIDKIDLMVVTHPHLDHLGGIMDVFARAEIGAFMDSGQSHTIETYAQMVSWLEEHHTRTIKARAGRTLKLGSQVELRVLGPSDPLLTDTRSDLNANSVILHMIVHGPNDGQSTQLLFLGDAEPATIARLRQEGRLPHVDVLKVAHHGSRWGTSRDLLEEISPRLAVISCGRDNRFGHPHEPTLAFLQDAHVATYRTDKSGTIVVTTNGKTMGVHAVPSTPAIIEQLSASAGIHVASAKPAYDPNALYYASRRSKVFHPEGCSHLKNIDPHHLIEFVSRDEAIRSGRRPARGCDTTPPTKDKSHVAIGPIVEADQYVAVKGSNTFHPAGCVHVSTGSDDLIVYDSAEEALATGRVPATGCQVKEKK